MLAAVPRRVPFIAQMEAVECAAASLAMILAYYGHHAPLSEVRRACGISRDGSTAQNIVVAAREYGLEPTAMRVEPTDLADLEDPLILHWDMNHFVVLERWTPRGAHIVDPGVGRRFVPSEDFNQSFTGICIEFEPGAEFTERPKTRVSLARYTALLRGAVGALGMVLVASLAIDVLATVVPLTTQLAIDQIVARRRVDWLWIVGAAAFGLVTFSALWSLMRGWLLVRIRAGLDVTITERFMAHLFALPVPFFAQRSTGDLMSRVQANRVMRELLAGQSVAILADATMLLVYLALMFAFDVGLSWIVLGAAAIYVFVFLVGRPIVQAGADTAQRKQILAVTALVQTLRGITTIKSAGAEASSHRRWLNAWIASLNSGARVAMKRQSVATILAGIQAAVPVVILLVGGQRVLDGSLTPGRLVGFEMLQAGLLGPLQSVVQALLSLQIVPVLLERMDDVLNSEIEPERETRSPRLEGEIELEGVHFRYAPTTPPVLSDVSMRIEKGTKVALVGPSGSGKSTLARLLLGLYPPTEGEIRLDGHDLSTLDPASVRRQYGVVLQETALFEGTVADNLRLFWPNAPMDHVVQAARVAQIHDDILALPRGYDTRVSSNGGALSGGQRQRLALARAIVHRPPVMILDEATSALDAVTEAAIERYLSTRACTRVVIAHRLSTIRDADMIFVLDGGRIVEQGRHDDLAAAGGPYARLLAGTHEERAAPVPPPERQPVTAKDLEIAEALRDWTSEERSDLAAQLVRSDIAAGARIVEQDARSTGLFFLLEGTVGIELAEPGLATWTVTELGPGAVFGEIGLLDGSPSSASVVARSDVRLLHLPYGRFQELLHRGDSLAVHAILSLGAIVAARTREAIRRCAELASKKAQSEPAETHTRARRLLPLAETLIGASLDRAELNAVEALGARAVFSRGGVLFELGAPADTLFVLLSGHVTLRRADGGTLGVADPGAILGESSAFDVGTHAMTAVAQNEVVALMIGRDSLVDLLLSGRRVARKLLSPITATLVRRFRLANYHLREAVALEDGELERAHAAREQAIDTAREEREALLVGSSGKVPTVVVKDDRDVPAACIAALLRAMGRPVSVSNVVEAFASVGAVSVEAIPEVARAFGLSCRRLEVPLTELRELTEPVVAVTTKERVVVLERRGLVHWYVMDPMRGPVRLGEREMQEAFSGIAFELRDATSSAEIATLPERVGDFARRRIGDIARLLGITLLLQSLVFLGALAMALAVQRVFPSSDRSLLGILVAASGAVAMGFVVTQQMQGRAIEHLRAHFDRELLDQLMTHVLKLPIAFFDRNPPGEVLTRLQAFENVRSLFSTQGVSALLSTLSLAVGALMMLAIAPQLMVAPLGVLIVFGIVARTLFPAVRRAAAAEIAARGRQQDRLMELLQGIVTLRMAGDRRAPQRRWFPSFVEELGAALRQERVMALVVPVLEWVRGGALVWCVWRGSQAVLAGTMSLAALVAFLGVLASFLAATHALSLQMLRSAPSLVDYGLAQSTFREPREQTSATLLSPGQLRGRIGVERVSFRYAPEGPLVLEDVSLEIESGTKVALVGSSGSGKSTLGRLLLGLYLPTSGRILFDGRDVTGLDLEALRRRMGVVLQEPFLLGGSIRENISLGVEGVPLERVVAAAQQAAIHDDIEKMAMQYDTLVAEGGTTFSGGQRQRLAIARALVSKPAVLLLDEATSALDNFSQALIEHHLAESTATRVVIAHRLSTVVDADRIVVLHKGRIVEQGKHDELIAQRGAYYELVRAQL